MGWPKEHRQATRAAIVEAAATLFTQYGFDRVGIDEVMSYAGLTRGAFYAHFASKSELYGEAIVMAALRARDYTLDGECGGLSVGEMAERYLRPDRTENGDDRCPLAFLTTDIHQREASVRNAYTKVFAGFSDEVADKLGRSSLSDEALQAAVMLVGGLAIARALNDDEFSGRLLGACGRGVAKLEKV